MKGDDPSVPRSVEVDEWRLSSSRDDVLRMAPGRSKAGDGDDRPSRAPAAFCSVVKELRSGEGGKAPTRTSGWEGAWLSNVGRSGEREPLTAASTSTG